MRGLSHLGRSDATASVEDVSPQRFSRGQKPAITPHTFVEECRSMLRRQCKFVAKCFLLWLLFSLVANFTWAQSETATVSGQVVDPSGLNITGAQVKLVDIDRDTSIGATTNTSGLYTFPSVKPGRYRMEVTAAGFRVVNVTGVTVNVQDHLEQNFKLVVGSISESMTVTADAYNVNTTDATVSTVVDRNFAENLPMNGRSFQALIQLTPGVVSIASTSQDSGQFSVNGQRGTSNYFTIDGVSANIGMSAVSGQGALNNGAAGTLSGFSVQGGTNSLVSVDALQEFRIQTSTFAPEFGRTPGAQVSIVTRSGTNEFHGTLFDYLRNDALDANDWFANRDGLTKPQERQNDFGGMLAGPIIKNQTFFLFSYEGLRLRLPEVAESEVPSQSARVSAITTLQPYFNSFPVPAAGAPDINGISPFNASYSNRSTLDAVSLRIDQRVSDKVTLFGRYNYSPSDLFQRPLGHSLNTLETSKIATQTLTIGSSWNISPELSNELRLNYSRVNARANFVLDNFGGAVPLTVSELGFPTPFDTPNSSFAFQLFDGVSGLYLGQVAHNVQRQWNVVDGLTWQRGSHTLKFGVDYRRLMPTSAPPQYVQDAFFLSVNAAESGQMLFSILQQARGAALLFQNLGSFAQDTWRITSRLTVTYGLRWDIDSAPSSRNGLNLQAVTNFDDPSQLALAPDGVPIFATKFGNVAPRLGMAYQFTQKQGWETVLRAGWGKFFDLATAEVGELTNGISYPFGSTAFPCCAFPLDAAAATPPPISRSLPFGVLTAFDPKLGLPYVQEWNVALEQSLGRNQSVTASYIGSAGRRLIETVGIISPNPNFGEALLISNGGTSDYNALQIQANRRLSHSLQALASYTWAHSIDTGSASSLGQASNTFDPRAGAQANRGPSDFDIRQAFSAGVTYDIPVPHVNALAKAILRGWSLQNIILARSAPPVNVDDSAFQGLLGSSFADVRADLIPGIPSYIFGSQYPGGKILNNTPNLGGPGCLGPYCPPPTDANGNPLRQGNLSRNALRGFGATQWDFAVHREFPIRESLKLQFRAEMFNLLNHPNFGSPIGDLSNNSQFGQSVQMLGRSLDGQNQGGGSFSSLYQIGGPRSIQLALKLVF
jgi:hypothetical protein